MRTFIEYKGVRVIPESPEVLLEECVASKSNSSVFAERRDRLIMRLVPLTLSIASSYYRRKNGLEDDIPGEAMQTLVVAVDRLITKGSHPNISAYIHLSVKGSMINFVNARNKRLSKEPVYEDTFFTSILAHSTITEKRRVADILCFLSGDIKQLAGVSKTIPCNELVQKRLDGYSLEEIRESIFESTGKTVSKQAVSQMVKKTFDYLRRVSIF